MKSLWILLTLASATGCTHVGGAGAEPAARVTASVVAAAPGPPPASATS
ncbi:MAG: hypothetical protein R3F60_26645 [bacterium]